MYHSIVKRIAKKTFLRVNQKEYDAILKDCSPTIHHRFSGDHALGGERNDREALRRWFDRLGRLTPGLTITVNDVWVSGWPNGTTAIIRWVATDTLLDHTPYENRGVHVVRMQWGKVVDIDVHEDSQTVANAFRIQAANGLEEALAEPITS